MLLSTLSVGGDVQEFSSCMRAVGCELASHLNLRMIYVHRHCVLDRSAGLQTKTTYGLEMVKL